MVNAQNPLFDISGPILDRDTIKLFKVRKSRLKVFQKIYTLDKQPNSLLL
jgi:hypothetical protein